MAMQNFFFRGGGGVNKVHYGLQENNEQDGACPGVEPGTSRTLSDNHATRPTGHPYHFHKFLFDLFSFSDRCLPQNATYLSSTTFRKNFFLKFWAGYKSIAILREGQGWRSDERTRRLPLMLPGFKSWRRRHVRAG